MAMKRITLASLAAAAALAGCGGGGDGAGDEGSGAEGGDEEAVIATVEGVDGGEITEADLEAAVSATAVAEGRTPPAPGSPEYDLIAGDALDELVLSRWIEGQAAAEGISASDEEVAARVDEVVAGRFGGDAEAFAAQLTEGGYCSDEETAAGTDPLECARVIEGFRNDLLAERLGDPPAGDLLATWGARTECETEVVSRLCEGDEPQPPPDIPPASGLEQPAGQDP